MWLPLEIPAVFSEKLEKGIKSIFTRMKKLIGQPSFNISIR